MIKNSQQRKQALQSIFLQQLYNHEPSRIIFQYSQEILNQPIMQTLTQYSSKTISQQILKSQLKQIQQFFSKIPYSQCKIQHFLLIMVRVMKFPFQKTPYYLIGLKDMFYQIVQRGQDYITFELFCKYIFGEFVTIRQDENNTEFQTKFQEQKNQDYFVHDTGIKKMIYIKDLKIIVTLDQNAQYLKVYNSEMKVIKKVGPSKQKHSNKRPFIIDFDYSEMSFRLCLLLSDCTLCIIKLQNYLKKTQTQFNAISSNQITMFSPYSSRYLLYLQMINRWCVVAQNNLILIFDPLKCNQQVNYQILELDRKTQNNIKMLLEVVSTNTVCIVAGNQVLFYDQSLSSIKWNTYTHKCEITTFRYFQQKNKFYLAGNEKIITILDVVRTTRQLKISFADFRLKYNILTFEVFALTNTIVLIDERNQLAVYNQTKNICQNSQNYKHVVKNHKRNLQIYKMSKTHFAIFQTYQVILSQNKVAFEKQTEYNFGKQFFYDKQTQSIYLSVNNEIINFSLLNGDIRKNYSKESSNLRNYQTFFLGQDTDLFILDKEKNLFQLYFKGEKLDWDNRNNKKKLTMESIIKCFYHQPKRTVIIVSPTIITQILNKKDNNFIVLNTCQLNNLSNIVKVYFRDPVISLLTLQNVVYQLNYTQYSVIRSVLYQFPQITSQIQNRAIKSFDHDFDYGFDIILNRSNQIYIVSTMNEKKQYYIKIQDYLSIKDRNIVFTSMKYQKLEIGKTKQLYLILFNQYGYFAQFHLNNVLSSFINNLQIPLNSSFRQTDNHKSINFSNLEVKKIILSQQNKKCQKNNLTVIKAHQDSIQLVAKIYLQFVLTLTVSKDGHTKLWLNQQCLLSLKLPFLVKFVSNLQKIENSKTVKSVKRVLQIVGNINSSFNKINSPIINLKKSKIMRKKVENSPINFQQPLKIQLDSKEIQEIIFRPTHQTPNRSKKIFSKPRTVNFSRTISVNPHPWRKNQSFIKIFQSLTPKSKSQMPRDLVILRKALDMTPSNLVPRNLTSRTKRISQSTLQILPQLNEYVPEVLPIKDNEINNDEDEQQQKKLERFEVCMYVSRFKFKKRVNELDEIDKQFHKKWMQLSNKKWIPHRNNLINDQKNKKNKGSVSNQKNNDTSTSNLNIKEKMKNLYNKRLHFQ